MDATLLLALLAAAAALPGAAFVLPGLSRPLAAATVALGFWPFARGAQLAMEIATILVPTTEAWRGWILRVIVLAACVALAFLLATARAERWWPLLVAPVALAAIVTLARPMAVVVMPGALLAAVALAPVVRSGFGDPVHWRRLGAGMSLLALLLMDAALVREALI